tara:strand:- start:377 stop:1402 length:1026 start_codon:yes stop_codon:yes gene_type:complete
MNNVNKINLSERIFLAGAYGMVGSSIYKILKKNSYGLKKNNGIIFMPKRKDLNLLNHNEVDYYFNKNKPTVVILAAAKVGGIYANSNQPYDFLIENLKIQNNVIQASLKNQIKRLLFLGSSCIYPKNCSQPIKEESLLTGALEITNESYAIAKIAGIKLCQSLRAQFNFDAISLMPTNLYGPNDNYHSENSHVMASLISKFSIAKKLSLPNVTCWGSGNPLREFMHVDDLGDAVLHSLEKWDPSDKDAPKNSKGEPLGYLNIGTGKDISIKELAKLISNICEYKGEIVWDKSKPDGTPKKQLDVSRINKTGWRSKINLKDGIKMTLEDFKKNHLEKKLKEM